MTTPSDDTGSIETTAPPTTASQPGTTARVRATSAPGRRARSSEEAAVTTIEIPTVDGGAGTASFRRGAQNQRRERRAPAPVVLRFFVWLVLFLCVIGAGGLIVEHARPTWLSVLRHSAPVRANAVLSTQQTRPQPTTDTITPVGNAQSALSYSVSSSSYTIVVTTAARCYVVLHTPANSSTIAFASVITPQMSPKRFPVVGSASITLDAQATSLSITNGSKTLGVITHPKLGVAYTFETTSG